MSYEFKSGTLINQYVLRERIAFGGESEVWRATKDRREVAIKLRTPARLSNYDEVKKRLDEFENESAIWEEFSTESVYIANILDVFKESVTDEASGEDWLILGIVSELSRIGDLLVAIENGTLRKDLETERQLIEFMLHILSSVKAGREIAKFHCDIKPKNILLYKNDGHFLPKLTDFGIASTALRRQKGFTPVYSAPEIVDGGMPTEQSDVYSLGITFLDILYGTRLNDGQKVDTAVEFKSGRDYKHYLERIDRGKTRMTSRLGRIRALVETMTNEVASERASLDSIERALRRIAFSQDHYPAKTVADTYIWHPSVHETLNEKLYYFLVKGGNPAIDLLNLNSHLSHAGFKGFSLRSVMGEWDYVIRMWISQSPSLNEARDAIMTASIKHALLEVKTSSFELRRGRRHAGPEKLPEETEREMLQKIEQCAETDACKKLSEANYVIGLLNNDPELFRVTLLVTVPHDQIALSSFFSSILEEELTIDGRVIDLRYYVVEPAGSDVRIVVKFMHSNFVQCRRSLLQSFGALAKYGNQFRFSTLFDANAARDVLSDDGSIIRRIENGHPDES